MSLFLSILMALTLGGGVQQPPANGDASGPDPQSLANLALLLRKAERSTGRG
jgi:hypothetical protein